MPQSIVLSLVAQSNISCQHLRGYSLQKLFLDLLETVDPELGRALRRDQRNSSYSLSALQVKSLTPVDSLTGRSADSSTTIHQPLPKSNVRLLIAKAQVIELQYEHSQAIAPQSPCWWRISLLDDVLFEPLVFLLSQLENEVFQLGDGRVKIGQVAAEIPGVDWASSCSYQDIYEHASAHERNIHFQFFTPTAFEKGDHTTPLPSADSVFHPLRRCWNRYSGLAFAPNLINNIVPTHFDIQTEVVHSSQRHSYDAIVGCIGHISFRIMGDHDPLIIKRLNILADFSRYCSIGHNICSGMGIIRRVSHDNHSHVVQRQF
ncbi:MAG: CRISPR system precrRNA processing endoribonuclease RAMP protein Cas6 [Phormidesmis sp. RL_2_1]|nr:CRISPR system precrRNA processing endoribonuclease RAMP protein Cas6 [Phormidesmis sp. RL_2_1]